MLTISTSRNGAASHSIIQIFTILLTLLSSSQAMALQVSETPAFAVSPSNVNSFATPVAYYQGNIYVVSVEPPIGNGNGVNLRTVIRKGSERQGRWHWETATIDGATLDDTYHTQASVAIDKAGYVHVVYNMHNMPWQYVVSKYPGDIAAFDFKGDMISLTEKSTVKHLNKTPFPSIGAAAIPGNQITYPAFFYDRQEDLYLTYRFATRPKKAFGNRGFAFALARYDTATKRWVSLGGQIKVTSGEATLPKGLAETEVKALLFSEGWQPQLLRLFFDRNNRMHLSWSWREFYGNSPFVRPSYAYSRDNESLFYRADGGKHNLPVSLQDSGLLFPDRKESILSSPLTYVTADPSGTPYIVTNEKGKTSEVRYYQWAANEWSAGEPAPSGAQILEIDDTGRQWAFATGLKLFTRDDAALTWAKVYEDTSQPRFGFLKALHLHNQNRFLVFAQSVDGKSAKIYDIQY